jgi:hypothetical protein
MCRYYCSRHSRQAKNYNALFGVASRYAEQGTWQIEYVHLSVGYATLHLRLIKCRPCGTYGLPLARICNPCVEQQETDAVARVTNPRKRGL